MEILYFFIHYSMYRLISKALRGLRLGMWVAEFAIYLDFSNIYLWLALDDVVDVDVESNPSRRNSCKLHQASPDLAWMDWSRPDVHKRNLEKIKDKT